MTDELAKNVERPPLFRVLIQPNPTVSSRFVITFLTCFIVLSMVIVLSFVALGYWVILPFAGLGFWW